ncbi:acyl-CoA thioesterase [Silvanigrella aquatica]|uniref:Thioesterase n=1 Tax=Silvanigrella aquatica TaxID=1915309 RepID=A0A1L4D0I9_9BACT|nr:acyl-CoA thioesterase [Silvanigrella aquatica]APJ03707.1 thioesterase [Silvanigrella aquatica]
MPKIKNAKLFKYELTIKENHLDSFAHVNNAVYLQILEEARWEFITELGFGLEEIQKSGKGPVILEVNLKFIKELKLREKVRIETQCIDAQSKILHLEQKIFNSKNELCTTAHYILGYFDLNTRKLIHQSPEWFRAVGIEIE